MVTMSLPNIAISMNRIYPFKRKKRVGAERWYEKISISYSGQFRNSISTKENRLFQANIIKDWNNGFSHNIPISASYKLFNYIDLTLSANYNERWYTYKSVKEYNAYDRPHGVPPYLWLQPRVRLLHVSEPKYHALRLLPAVEDLRR